MFKRVALSLAAVSALSILVTGASFALFTAQTQNVNNTFSAGTVTLGSVTAFSCGVSTDNMAPGDNGSCDVSVTYTGSLDAWIGYTASGSGDLFSGSTPMSITYSGAQDGSYYIIGKKSSGETATASIGYNFPLAAGNEYQGKNGAINLSFHAVQAKNNTKADNSGPNAWN